MKNKFSSMLVAAGLAIAALGVIAQDPESAFRESIRSVISTNGVNVAVRDTNTTTSVTLYTPAFKGQILFGSTGGTNHTWLATDATTNGWVRVQ